MLNSVAGVDVKKPDDYTWSSSDKQVQCEYWCLVGFFSLLMQDDFFNF